MEGSDNEEEATRVISKCKYLDKQEPTKLSKPKLVIRTREDAVSGKTPQVLQSTDGSNYQTSCPNFDREYLIDNIKPLGYNRCRGLIQLNESSNQKMRNNLVAKSVINKRVQAAKDKMKK